MVKQKNGALYLWDLNGKLISKTEPIDRPVRVDVRYKMQLGNREIDIVVCSVRSLNEIKVFEIDPQNRKLIDITTDSQSLLPKGRSLNRKDQGQLVD